MSRAVGDSAVASLLCTIKQFTDHGGAHSLDELFCTCFSSISPGLLAYEMLEAGVREEDIPPFQGLAPYGKLGAIEDILKNGVLSINMDRFDCPFFALRAEWFLAVERVGILSAGDIEAANEEIVSFVVDAIKKAYHKKEDIEYHDSQVHWNGLIRRMGPFSRLLTSIRLSLDDSSGELIQSTGGQPLEAWASSCAEMEQIGSAVAKKAMTGDFE